MRRMKEKYWSKARYQTQKHSHSHYTAAIATDTVVTANGTYFSTIMGIERT